MFVEKLLKTILYNVNENKKLDDFYLLITFEFSMDKRGGQLRVFILDKHGKCLEQMLKWISENIILTEVEVFEDYIMLIKEAGRHPPNLCFIRLGQDGIPGLKTAGIVKQTSPETRIIFIADDRDYALDAHEVGADDYLLCPLERKRFEKCIETGKYNDSA